MTIENTSEKSRALIEAMAIASVTAQLSVLEADGWARIAPGAAVLTPDEQTELSLAEEERREITAILSSDTAWRNPATKSIPTGIRRLREIFGITRCRCGTLVNNPNHACVWHQARSDRETAIREREATPEPAAGNYRHASPEVIRLFAMAQRGQSPDEYNAEDNHTRHSAEKKIETALRVTGFELGPPAIPNKNCPEVTGPWPTLFAVHPSVQTVTDREDDRWRRTVDSWELFDKKIAEWRPFDLPLNRTSFFAPFVAAEVHS